MGERVWAAFKGTSPGASERDKALGKTHWVVKGQKEWTQTVGFVTLKSLIKQILDERWKVDKLGIVAHGRQRSGRIALDRELSMKNIRSWKKDFNNLASLCMKPGGRVIFFSCAASAGSNGDRLWCRLSEFMPNCEIVGFSKVLQTGS
ncbi:MAG: DUF4347 domain-containing protein, partial [Planctomycetota bacterium]